MRDLEMRIWALVNVVLLLIFGILPPVILNQYNVLPGFSTPLDITFWLTFGVAIVLLLAYVMMCMNNRRKQERVPFLVSEVLLIIIQFLPTITWCYSLVDTNDSIWIAAAVTNIVLFFAFFCVYLWLYYKNTRARYQ